MSAISRNRELAFQRQNGLCFYCGFPMLCASALAPDGRAALLACTAEHLYPASAGGGNNSQNIVAACRYCNQTRHHAKKPLDPTAYAARVKRRVAAGRWHWMAQASFRRARAFVDQHGEQ